VGATDSNRPPEGDRWTGGAGPDADTTADTDTTRDTDTATVGENNKRVIMRIRRQATAALNKV